ncbi:hypothetical protein ABEB36_014119 [Hypothenemus hampei]|uniref:Tetratricopeptide SHNi-TPR domain-containing protein n=1 Tax=Hypothenemus hampei TaxID=57062 RepID=A0ABD1E472_HYPHA
MATINVNAESLDPKELYGKGVRAYIMEDYEEAVTALSKASELLVAKYKNDMHSSLADVYLYYGKSLLSLTREQSDALGEGVPKDAPEEDSDDDEVSKEAQEPSSSTASIDPEASTETEKQPEPEEKNEEASDLQLAWEVSELAKKIFEREQDRKGVAETLVVLGEISLESGNFEDAITDTKKALDIQKELFRSDSRAIAETYYKLGVAYSTNSQIDEAIECFNTSLEYLRNRINALEEMKDISEDDQYELEEIKGLLPDIEEKIADMQESKREVCCCEKSVKTISDGKSQPSEGPVNKLEVRRLCKK